MVIIKTENEIQRLRAGGPILARIVRELAKATTAGTTTKALDDLAYALIIEAGCKPAFLGYTPDGAKKPFPASLCISVNDEVVHGIPGDRVLREGDVVSLDLGLKYDGVFLDHAVTVIVGAGDAKDKMLLAATAEALEAGIAAIRMPGATTGDIGAAVEAVAKRYRLGIVRDLSGHGVGRHIHEDPYVPNYGKAGRGEKLRPGMVIAIEPMLTRGKEDVLLLKDGYTIVTADKSRAAHFEHTVLITDTGAEILTK